MGPNPHPPFRSGHLSSSRCISQQARFARVVQFDKWWQMASNVFCRHPYSGKILIFRWSETTHENFIIFRRWERFTASFLGGTKIAFLFGAGFFGNFWPFYEEVAPRADGRYTWSFFMGSLKNSWPENNGVKDWGGKCNVFSGVISPHLRLVFGPIL